MTARHPGHITLPRSEREFGMVVFKHVIADPAFECDRLRYLDVGDKKAVLLKHASGVPIAGFHRGWNAVFVYTGLDCCYLLDLAGDGARATWIVARDGTRLGDKLAELSADQLKRLRDAVRARGFAKPDGLIGDGIQLIEPRLLRDILALAASGDAADARDAETQRSLAVLAPPHALRTHLQWSGNERTKLLAHGWEFDAARTCRGIGSASVVQADAVPAASRYLLTLTVSPPPSCREPTLEIGLVVNGRPFGIIRLDTKWQAEGAALAYWLPPDLVSGKALEIAFRHELDFTLDALKLSYGSAPRAAPLETAELMSRFENLGDNCEFGLVQRHFKAEPLGLLRFAGLRGPRRLIEFLEDDFGQFGEPGSLGVNVIGGEYWVFDKTYGIAYHTFRYHTECSAEEVIRENEIKASYLKRKFREDLEDAEKILVYKRVVTQDPHEIIALHAALNRFGGSNKLLWVTQADADHAPGQVEWIGNRLLKGYVRSISLDNANDFDAGMWLRLCRTALAAFEAAGPV